MLPQLQQGSCCHQKWAWDWLRVVPLLPVMSRSILNNTELTDLTPCILQQTDGLGLYEVIGSGTLRFNLAWVCLPASLIFLLHMGIMPDWVWHNIITTSPAFLLFKIRHCLVQRVHTPRTRSHLSNKWRLHYDIHLHFFSFIAPWTPSASYRGPITHTAPKPKLMPLSLCVPCVHQGLCCVYNHLKFHCIDNPMNHFICMTLHCFQG